jgi:Domain of unknown function (DUF4145)
MGKVTEKVDVNKTKDQKHKVYCVQCKRETNHIVLQSIDCDGSEVIGHYAGHPETIDWSNNYQIIQCQGCDAISFRHVSWFSEAQQQIGEDEWDNGSSTWLYPKRSDKTKPIKDYYNVPNTLRRIYRETLECFNNDALTLCAAGLRAIIDGICADQKIVDGPVPIKKPDSSTEIKRKGNLEGKIAGLGEKGILTQKNAAILHEHRFLGNEAVHELNQPTPDELTLATEIVEHILDSLYEMPDKAEELQRLRINRRKK